jgi:hypothetical protein
MNLPQNLSTNTKQQTIKLNYIDSNEENVGRPLVGLRGSNIKNLHYR